MSSRDISQKTFLLGVGAQKAGTTWLHTYLQAHPEVYMSDIKEMHFFTEMYLPAGNRELVRRMHYGWLTNIAQRLSKTGVVGPEAISIAHDLLDRAAMRDNPQAYFEYFARRVGADQTVFGEITPAYSTLDAVHFQQIAGMHGDIRPVFIMRDPVARFWSAMRMAERNDPSLSATDLVAGHLKHEPDLQRGRYDLTLEALRQVFGSRTIVLFYEQLFQQDTIDRLCGALGITALPAQFEVRQNVSPQTVPLTEAAGAQIFAAFAPVYDYLQQAGYILPPAWQESIARYGGKP